MKEKNLMAENIHWLGHDTFRVAAEKVIITDPFRIRRAEPCDIILVTHEHYDHCSPEDIEKVSGPHTVIIAPPDCSAKLKGAVRTMRPGDSLEVRGIRIEAVPAYNIDKKFHTRDRGWVGYIFTANGQRVYIAGDTDRIPEMKGLKADIALLPVSGTYVMTAEEAVKAALDINPRLAIPMHYGSIVGSRDDAERFAEGLRGRIDVSILPEE
jgi:L-ascorbate metabolism protein UlaG (beta-lactamase superfamily)